MKYDGFIFIKLCTTDGIGFLPLAEKYTKLLLFNIYSVDVSEHIMYYSAIEVHEDKRNDEASTLERVHVLLGAYRDESGVYPVQFEIKEYRDRENKLYFMEEKTC